MCFRLLLRSIDPVEILHYNADGRFDLETAKKAEYAPINVGNTIGPM